jgi:hypothetical protein
MALSQYTQLKVALQESQKIPRSSTPVWSSAEKSAQQGNSKLRFKVKGRLIIRLIKVIITY